MRFGAFCEQPSPTITTLRRSFRSCVVSLQLTSAFVSPKFDKKDISSFEPGPPTSRLHPELRECYDLPDSLFDLTFLIGNFLPTVRSCAATGADQVVVSPTASCAYNLSIPGISSAPSSCNCLGDTRVGKIIWPPCVWPMTSWRCKMPALSFPQASASTPPMRSLSATT